MTGLRVFSNVRRAGSAVVFGVGVGFLTSCSAGEPYPDLLSIGQVQGVVPEAGDGSRFRSPLHGETVTVRGTVHQVLRWRTLEGHDVYGMMLQNTGKDRDGDPATSDGIFVYTGHQPTLRRLPQGDYRVRVGDLVTVRGQVNERYGQTEIDEAKVLETGKGDLPEPVALVLPESFGARQRMLERLEGMRVRLASGAVAVSGTHPNTRTHDMQVWVVPGDHPVAGRENPAARRLYRPAHPLSHLHGEEVADAFGRRLTVGSLGLAARLEDRDASLPPLYAGSRFTGALVGGIQYSYGDYVLQPEDLPGVDAVSEPSPAAPEDDGRLRVATYNVENLYDFVDDPFDDCDFNGDSGCPGTRFPLNYVPPSSEVYRARVRRIAEQIVRQLHSPDVVLIQEVEDQDIAKLMDGAMWYGRENDADGRVDALQDVALRVAELGGPSYEVAVDRDGTDDRGIICAWLYRDDRLRPLDPEKTGGLLKGNEHLPGGWEWFSHASDTSNPKAFNTVFRGDLDSDPGMVGVFSRAVQVLALEDRENGRVIWLLNNHFSAGPNRRVDRRTRQAAMNADLAKAILARDEAALVVAGGDLNVFPRPDDPLDPPSDQLGPLYEAGLFNVVDRVTAEAPARAYSYIYEGVANVLDQMFLSPAARQRVVRADYLKLNAGAPERFPEEPPLRASDHDPLVIELAW